MYRVRLGDAFSAIFKTKPKENLEYTLSAERTKNKYIEKLIKDSPKTVEGIQNKIAQGKKKNTILIIS